MIFLTGDIHGANSIGRMNSTLFPQNKELTKSDYLIILGDFGMLWEQEMSKSEAYWLKWMADKNCTTLFVDGNHENFDRINALPQVEMFGSTVGKVNDSVFHLRRGEVYLIDGLKILTIGGAESIDKHQRTEHVTWWREELLSMQDIYNALDNLEKHNWEVDYVLSHTCPVQIYPEVRDQYKTKMKDPTMKELGEIYKQLTFKHWYFGHFHKDRTLSDEFTVLYEFIIEIGANIHGLFCMQG